VSDCTVGKSLLRAEQDLFAAFHQRSIVLWTSIAVGDRMFLGMQDLDFCSNLFKFYPIYPNLRRRAATIL